MAKTLFDVTTVGEMMLRLSVPAGHRLEMARTLDLMPAGAEGNVVAALGRLGRQCAWVGGLSDNPLGRLVASHLRLAGVDLGGVVWCKTGRIGTYYVEYASPPRSTEVIYDRAESCAAHLGPDQIDWHYLLNSRLVHLTGITPALSRACRTLVTEVLARARAAGVATSFDVNYRQKLWTEAEARDVLTGLIRGVDLLFCSYADACRLFGLSDTPERVVSRLQEESGAGHVVISIGEDGVVASDGSQFWHVPALSVHIVDRLGAGDALAAGVIHGWLDGDFARGLQYGVALAALVLSQYGDMVVTTRTEMASLLANVSSSPVGMVSLSR